MKVIDGLKKVSLNVNYQNKEYTKGCSLTIPSSQGKYSSLKRGVSPSKGVGNNREVVKVLNGMYLKLKADGDKKDTAMFAKEFQRVVYNNEYGKDNGREN